MFLSHQTLLQAKQINKLLFLIMSKSLGILTCLFGLDNNVTQTDITCSLKSYLFLAWTNYKFVLHHQGICKGKTDFFFFLLENHCYRPQMKRSFSRELIIKVICNILALDSLVLHSCYREISADINV